MRIALLSPYSWTYPGGVTRHIDSLADELLGAGHDVHILAPLDPDDALSTRLHSGARPQALRPPEYLHPLGRTVGIPANGAVSNMALTPSSVLRLRRALCEGRYDVVHIHEPVVPVLGWDALMSPGPAALVGTFHTYSENRITNGIAAVPLGARRRMNRLHMRIAVSEAASWTARRFYGGRYRVIPNGVHLHDDLPEPAAVPTGHEGGARLGGELRIVFVGQAVERKGLPVLLRAFEALREHVPASLTIVGAGPGEVEHMLLDERGVRALGKVSEQRKRAELAAADVLCAPSLGGESFGMVLTEAFAASTPVLASDIPGYRDVVRDGRDGELVPAADPIALAEALRRLALEPARRERMARSARERAERFAWPHVARDVSDCYEEAVARAATAQRRPARVQRAAQRHGYSSADGLPRIPAEVLPSLAPAAPVLSGRPRRIRALRRAGLAASSLAGAALAALALERVGLARVVASLVASKPGLILVGLALMCAAMFARALSWHAILGVAPTWRRASRRDAMQGTFIGVLMSSTLPARLGEPSRALVLARRIGRARDTLPAVLGTMVSQALLNLFALAILGGVAISSVRVLDAHDRALFAIALAPVAVLVLLTLAPIALAALAESSRVGRRSRKRQMLLASMRRALERLRDGLRVFAHPRQALPATVAQLAAWALQWAACWVLLVALGLGPSVGATAAAGVLFAVNVTAVLPPTPANIGVFQAACVAVLAGVYHVATADAIAYGIVLQAVEVGTALLMGLPALLGEGLSWREVRLRTVHATPVRLPALPAAPHAARSLES